MWNRKRRQKNPDPPFLGPCFGRAFFCTFFPPRRMVASVSWLGYRPQEAKRRGSLSFSPILECHSCCRWMAHIDQSLSDRSAVERENTPRDRWSPGDLVTRVLTWPPTQSVRVFFNSYCVYTFEIITKFLWTFLATCGYLKIVFCLS